MNEERFQNQDGNINVSHEHEEGDTKISSAILITVALVLVILGSVFWVQTSEPVTNSLQTSFNNLPGLQGFAMAVDKNNSMFGMKQVRIRRSGDSETLEEKDYQVMWGDDTKFFIYKDHDSVEEGNAVPTNSGALVPNRTVVIKSDRTTPIEDGDSLKATEVHIIL